MKKIWMILGVALFFSLNLAAQNSPKKPKLVVGIVVDQMRQEYLYKYAARYGEDGFKRLMGDGFMMKNAHYNYIPTYTGPGHASVYTGTTPAVHGIIGNSWYSRKLNAAIYCAGDSTVSAVGGSQASGQISPRNMLTTTITDELRFSNNKKSKVVGIAIKDRGASLPAGHLGDAYWYDSGTGEFMTSTYYSDALPKWVEDFNGRELAAKYLENTWNTLYPVDSYVNSIADNNDFEVGFGGKETPTFPYNLAELKAQNGELGMVATTPYGNTLTLDFAYAALEGEQLGMRGETDFLALSFSTPDYIGHRFGPTSVELEDNYLRLDQEIAKFLNYLDQTYGKGEYLIFLTADHGVADIATYMMSENVPAGNFRLSYVNGVLKAYFNEVYGEGEWIKNFSNDQIFLNTDLAIEKDIDIDDMEEAAARFMLRFNGVKEVYTSTAMRNVDFTEGSAALLQNGYNHKASGELLVILEPGWLTGGPRGTTHGTGFSYDTHVPILFYGWGVKAGSSSRKVAITDIAPTLSMMLGIRLPNGSTGQPLLEILE
ncbi:alkaline phosphatase PafA [Algoriphagus namhaensis]|uniref:Alkaline phosphatase PafA n=1 Tax=Algoriphagus namhaensis TaxID=915353 RepID=A0ABV8AWI4_9BACT